MQFGPDFEPPIYAFLHQCGVRGYSERLQVHITEACLVPVYLLSSADASSLCCASIPFCAAQTPRLLHVYFLTTMQPVFCACAVVPFWNPDSRLKWLRNKWRARYDQNVLLLHRAINVPLCVFKATQQPPIYDDTSPRRVLYVSD